MLIVKQLAILSSVNSKPTAENFSLLFFGNRDLLYFIAFFNSVNHFKTFYYFAETCVVPVKMGGVFSAMANKELRAPGISSSMRH